MSYRPLDGIRVLDLTRLIPGDLASRKLADLGADVVKVEEPVTGDYLRLLPPRVDGVGVHHWNLNRGKRSITLDLTSAEGKAKFLGLANVADVIIEVSMPGKFKALGIDFAELRRARPALIVCSISGFGQTGPLAGLPAHGMMMDGLAGCLLTKQRQGRLAMNLDLSTSIANEAGALNAALAVTAAVSHVLRGGAGAWIDISCWDAGVEMQRSAIGRAAAGSDADEDEIDDSVLYSLYRAADGLYILFCAIEFKFWQRFCDGIERPDLKPCWRGPPGGVDHRVGDEPLRAQLAAIFAEHDSRTWFAKFVDWKVPGSVLLHSRDLVRFEHTAARGLLRKVTGSSLPEIADPIRWMEDGSRPGQDSKPSATLGADTQAVFEDWLRKKGQ